MTTTIPIWFGPEDRPLFGWFHGPAAGRARSGVVICPSFALEYIQAHYAVRLLAERLCSLGMCVVRFDYDGMGDSAGSSRDSKRVESWMASISSAVDVIRNTGVHAISLVGMRIGATLAANVAAHQGGVERIVLWDPCLSGRAFLREGVAASAFGLGEPVNRVGAADLPGLSLDAEAAAELGAISLAGLPSSPARNTLVLIRAGRTVASEVLVSLGSESVECLEAKGQSELLERGSPNQELPRATINEISDWLALKDSTEPVAFRAPSSAGPKALGRDRYGREIVERLIAIGPHGLFGISTEVPEAPRGPTALFLSVANEHHVGPTRLWVDLARHWAGEGIPSVRFDLSGLGDSPLRHEDQAEFIPVAPEAFDDVVDAARSASPSDPSNVVLVGLCGSGYQALDSAFELDPRGVLVINPILSFVPPECKAGLPLDARRHVALPKSPIVKAFHHDGPLSPIRRQLPDLGWWLRLLVAGQRRPGSWIAGLGRRGISTLVVAGEREGRPIRLGSTRFIRRKWERTGTFNFIFNPELEHGLLINRQRQEVFDLMTRHAVEKFAPAEAPSPPVMQLL